MRITRPLVLTSAALVGCAIAPPVAALGPVAIEGAQSGASSGLLDDTWESDIDLGSFYMTTKSINAHDIWGRSDQTGAKFTGTGIGVALIDSGVAPVEGLDATGKVIHGPDLSFDADDPALRYLDGFGHGTHMASIIAGRDDAVQSGNENTEQHFVGVAPDAHVVSLKVAAADGSVDVSQVIAAIEWVVAHKDDPELGIRVLNLSYGTDSLQSYEIDPLAYAVQQAWEAGIVVVVAGGNDGAAGTTLTNPAINPFVIAVGASDHHGTEGRDDDTVATFSSIGNADRTVDVLAPGRSIVGLRAPGSWIDEANPEARVALEGEDRLFRGSGSSQAAAVVSGAVALMLDEQPTLTPDQVKHLLMANAEPLDGGFVGQGAGLIQLKDIHTLDASGTGTQPFAAATGLGSLDLARGSAFVADPVTGEELRGEIDIFGNAWNPQAWVAGERWNGRSWRGAAWSGDGWDTTGTWTGRSWRHDQWSAGTWTGRSWRSETWSGRSWRNGTWTGRSWRDSSWTGRSWRGDAWQ